MRDLYHPRGVRDYSLRRDAPIPGTVTRSWLRFSGFALLVIEETWNNADTRGTYLDGELMNRVALYGVVDSVSTRRLRWYQTLNRRRSRDACYVVAEVARYNPRVCLMLTDRVIGGFVSLPLYSRARQFLDLQLARDWLEGDPILDDGTIRQRLDCGMAGLMSGNWKAPDPSYVPLA
jgi:hypothetical protein